MKKDDEKQIRSKLFLLRQKLSVQEMADEIKISRQTLSGFLNGGSLNPNNLEKAKQLIEKHTIITDNTDETKAGIIELFKDDFRDILRLLESPALSDDIKMKRILDRFTEYTSFLNDLRKQYDDLINK